MPVSLKTVEITPFASPLRFSFRHGAKTHSACEALIITVTTSDGAVGRGEVQTRPYLTGETLQGAAEAIHSQLWPLLVAGRWPDIPSWWQTMGQIHMVADELGCQAAFAGLELAATQAVAGALGTSLTRMALDLFEAVSPYPQSGATGAAPAMTPIPITGDWQTALLGVLLKLAGARAVKFKVDQQNLSRLAQELAGGSPRFRVTGLDANAAIPTGSWLALPEGSLRGLFLEQPTPPEEEGTWLALARHTGAVIVADESICSLSDGRRLRSNPGCGGWNLRYAKNGGLVGIRRLMEMIPQRPFRLHLGSLVGETCLLIPAFRALVACVPFDVVEPSRSRLMLRRQP